MGNGFQFIDIILFAMIAAFLIFRLRNVLGRRDGHEGGFSDSRKPRGSEDAQNGDDDNVVQLSDRNQDDDWSPMEEGASADGVDAPATSDDPLANGLAEIQRADRSFNPGEFMEGGAAAFEMILNAYAAGDTAVLKSLLSAEVYGNFSQAIRDREQAGEVLEDTLVDIKSAEIVEAFMEARQATVTVKFVSEQVNATRDENGDVVDGNPNAIITVTDFWTFARDTGSRDPNWTLVATRSLD
ncbi:MAG: Tim44 domain-containing protein [Alphaproteobacteria bacterium]|nr:Tim44 domain-containing protein [Alphaproteobacteria bacterium]